MNLKEKVFAMNLESLGFGPATNRALACEVARQRNMYVDDLAISEVTVGDVVRGFGRYKPGHNPGSCTRAFTQKLVGLGLTRFDWLCLPQSTVTPEALAALPRAKLLEQPALILGTSTSYLFYTVLCASPTCSHEEAGERFAEMTIGELLRFDEGFEEAKAVALALEVRQHYFKGVVKTREALRALGFGDEDGRLMRFGTREEEIKRLMKARKLSSDQADLILTTARQEGWIPEFFG